MTARADLADGATWDDEEPVVLVETTDATGRTRVYRYRLTTDRLVGGRLLAGRRLVPPTPADDPVTTDRSKEIARQAFESRGFRCYGGRQR